MPGDARALLLQGIARPRAQNPAPGPAHSAAPAVPAPSDGGLEVFHRLQRRMLLATLIATALAVPLCGLLFSWPTAFSLTVGASGALLYLRLLARSVARLGDTSRALEKTQLLVPIVLVLAASRLPQLEILPTFLGFLLYKPAVIVQALLDSPES